MKVDSSMILKPGVVLEVKKIDFNDPKIRALIDRSKHFQKEILKYKIVSPEKLSRIVNI